MKNIVTTKSNHWVQNLIPIILILIFFIHSTLSVNQISKTFDENTHFNFGLSLLHGNAQRPYESVMPISAWNALPNFISESLSNSEIKTVFSTFLSARIISILFACGLAYLVFYFSRSLYGYLPAIISLFLFIFDPNILAHAQLVTTDIFATGSLLLITFFAWRYIKNRNWINRILFASSFGFALITKFTAMSFIPLFFLILGLYDVVHFLSDDTQNRKKHFFILFREYLTLLIVVTVVSILILNIAYQFNLTFTLFGNYIFRSHIFSSLQNNYPFLNAIPIPIPYPHLQGFDWILAFEQTGQGHGRHYLLGHLRVGEGFPGYYMVAFLLKEPFSIQIMILLALMYYFIDKERRSHFWQQELFLFIPIVFYTIYFNFFYNSQIGIRYYLIIFPLLHIFAGSLFTKWNLFSQRQKILSIVSGLYLVVSVLSYYPYYIPYFNEMIWNRNTAYKYLVDSNLDWGQARGAFEQYLKDNPNVSYPTKFVRSGIFIVSANDLVGITRDPADYAWLRDNFEPIDNVAYSYFIFQVTPEEKQALCLNTTYCANK